MAYGALADEKVGADSSYRGTVSEVLASLMRPMCYTSDRPKVTVFFAEIVRSLRNPELIATFASCLQGQMEVIANQRKSRLLALTGLFHPAELMNLAMDEDFQPAEDELAEQETAWLRSAEPQDLISRLRRAGEWLDKGGDLDDSETFATSKLALEITVHRWGLPLLSLDPALWRRVVKRRSLLPQELAERLDASQAYLAGKEWQGLA
jgi:hypothetical protein